MQDFSQQRVEQAKSTRKHYDRAVEIARSFNGQPFTERQAMHEAWEDGYELAIQGDPRFTLLNEGDGKRLSLWTIKEEVVHG